MVYKLRASFVTFLIYFLASCFSLYSRFRFKSNLTCCYAPLLQSVAHIDAQYLLLIELGNT